MNDCFLVFIKSFSLEQFSRVFTGIYQCLNLIHYALTVFRISYTKPFAGSIQNFYSCSSVVNQFIHHQRDKEFALQVLHVLRIAQESLEELFTVSKVVGSKGTVDLSDVLADVTDLKVSSSSSASVTVHVTVMPNESRGSVCPG